MILNALMQRPRSIADHEALMTQRDTAAQQNALLQMQMQQTRAQLERQAARDNALRQYGLTEQGANALMQAGDFEGASKLAETLKAQQAQQARQQFMQGLAPVRPIQANAVSGVTGPRPEALSVVGQRKKFDPAEMLAAGFQPKEVADTQALIAPTKKVKEYTDERTADGRVVRTAMMEDGTVQRTDVTPFIKPEIKNTGRNWTSIDLVTGKSSNVAPIVMSAAEAAADSRAREGLGLQRDRLTFDRSEAEAKRAAAQPTAKKLTESEAKATSFLGQMRAAEETLGQLKPNQSDVWEQANVMMAGGRLNAAANSKGQQVRQAQEQWAEAFLRFKTGAAATEAEVRRNVNTFFPQLGDGPDVIEQKKRMREQAVADIAIVAGAGADRAEVVPSIRDRSKPQGDEALPKPATSAEAMKLPPGTRFIDPNGVVRVR